MCRTTKKTITINKYGLPLAEQIIFFNSFCLVRSERSYPKKKKICYHIIYTPKKKICINKTIYKIKMRSM